MMNTKSTTIQGVITADGRLELTEPPSLPPGPVEVTLTVVAAGENGMQTIRHPPEARIIDRGRGPEIEGTRITVYDILDYYKQNWHHSSIAIWLSLSSAQVLAAMAYIDTHNEEVWANYRIMLERDAKGNPPELQAKLDALVAERRALRIASRGPAPTPEVNGEGNPA
jgi:uncharacterized protein (DUF433 family)